jgi:hypothetical protein
MEAGPKFQNIVNIQHVRNIGMPFALLQPGSKNNHKLGGA